MIQNPKPAKEIEEKFNSKEGNSTWQSNKYRQNSNKQKSKKKKKWQARKKYLQFISQIKA